MSYQSAKNYKLNFIINRQLDQPILKLSSSNIAQNRFLHQTPWSQDKSRLRKNNQEEEQKHDYSQSSKFTEKQKYKTTTDQQFAKINRMEKFSSIQNLKLDPRDQKINLPFQSAYYTLMQKNNFQISFQPFQIELRDWLVDLIEICTSIGYNHLKNETLMQKEVKAFICKNILENIKIVFQKYSLIPMKDRFNLIKFINHQSYLIFDHIAKKYPQTSSKGVSKRIKSKIQKIDNRQSQQFDFLFRNNIHIKYREDGDYSQDIMKIVNKMISFSNQTYDPQMEMQQTNYEIFSEIMEFIFDYANLQPVKNTANEAVQLLCSKKHKIDEQMMELQKMGCKELQIEQKSSSDTRRYQKDSQKHVLIGHKIPIGVRMFTEEDLQSSNFKVYDSSILRMLTKWAEQLRNKIMNSQQTILRRMHKFKSNNGRLINIEPNMKQILYQEANKQIQVIQNFLNGLKEENYFLQSVFAQQNNKAKYAKNDTKVGIFAAKLNEIASQYVFKYINRLIHSLLTIPRKAAQRLSNDREKAVISSVNLLTFKIGDIMRCKCSCREQEFIKIMQVIDQLHTRFPYLLKIVRIKNRLQTENNDILINFLFGNKAECELQLSVVSSQKKYEKYSSIFSHLVYEIIRAELGPLSEMANIIVQYDPLAYFYSKSNNFGPQLIQNYKLNIHNKKEVGQQKRERALFRKQMNLSMNIELPFVCCTCNKLSIVYNPSYFYRNLSSLKRQCNQCLGSFYRNNCSDNLIKQQLSEFMLIHNFPEPQIREFYKNHLQFWDDKIFIEALRNQTQTQVSNIWFPTHGYMIRKNQKKPMLQLFTCIFDPQLSMVVFAKIDERGQKKRLVMIKIHCQKQKKIKTISKEFNNFVIFTLKDTQTLIENNVKYIKCNRKDCCGLKAKSGPILERQSMIQYKNWRRVQLPLQFQFTHIDLNYIPKAFDILQKQINRINEKNKVWKIRNTIQVIEAFDCKLQNISIVSKFIQLTDLNIGENKQLKNLKGIENCFNLKYLDCNNCNLENVNELTNLKRLQEVNLTNNTKLTSIEGLSSHLQLINVYLRNTALQTLSPLSNCLKLQAIDLQGCIRLTSLKDIQSNNLSYISIINCLSMMQFDLPILSLESLKNVQLYKSDTQNMMANMLTDYTMQYLVPLEHKARAINKINQILRIRRRTSANT